MKYIANFENNWFFSTTKFTKTLCSLCALWLINLTSAQSQDQNYIKSITFKKPTTEGPINVNDPADAIISVSYFDGLGRPIQHVAHKQSNSGKDIVTHIEYDAYGRRIKDYMTIRN